MSKTPSEDTVVAVAPAAPDSFHLPLEEFCARLSKTDKSVELIGAFYAHEKLAGRVHGSESNFLAQYQAFANKPV